MGLDEEKLLGLYIGALLHDIGKIAVPEMILNKPGHLINTELAIIRSHPERGYEMLEKTHFPWPVQDMILHHHERLDGSGYPEGIKGDKLSLEVRILGVCDVVEAMGSHRPYRASRKKEEILEEIKKGQGTKYDPKIVKIVLKIVEDGKIFQEKS